MGGRAVGGRSGKPGIGNLVSPVVTENSTIIFHEINRADRTEIQLLPGPNATIEFGLVPGVFGKANLCLLKLENPDEQRN
jgi:hypothetical protein